MKLVIAALVLLIPVFSFSQIDSAFIGKIKALDTADILKADTTAVVNDALTQKIRKLTSEKRGLTVETIMRIKITEEQQKDTTHPKAFYDKLVEEVTTGKTSKLIENSRINLYRKYFSEKDIDELIAFSKTSVSKKMGKEYILLLVQLVKDSEQLLKLAAGNMSKH